MNVDVSLRAGFERHVQYSRGVLRVCDDLYHLDSYSRVLVIAFGVHGQAMASLLVDQLGPLAGGIISTPGPPGQTQLSGFRYFHGGHPLPTAESARAAEAVLKTLSSIDQRGLAIYLVSAGSSVVESALHNEISIEELAEAYNILSESTCTPGEVKTILKHLSVVKGGRMALAAGQGAQQVSIFHRDSSSDSLESLACGPTMPDSSSVEDCYRLAAQHRLIERLPAGVREVFGRRALEETPDKDHPAFHHCRWWLITE